METLAVSVRYALVYEFMTQQQEDRDNLQPGESETEVFGLIHPVTRTLDWLIRHYPDAARSTVAEAIGQIETQLQIPRQVSAENLRTALLYRVGDTDDTTISDFLDKVLTPALSE